MELSAVAAIVFALVEARSGMAVPTGTVADELAGRDVVFFGELHDNAVGHRVHHQLFEALHQRRGDVVLSMEMFERDVQGVLDDYLAGRIDEATFKKYARPWKDYDEFYRPFIEYAKEHGLDVIAANTPRKVASLVGRKGVAAAAGSLGMPRSTTAPDGRYRELFDKTMKDTPGHGFGSDMLDRFYAAQCIKDDAMAEAIADYFAQHPARTPLVVHVCGKFHSDFGLGTVERLRPRMPLAQVGVLTMNTAEDPKNWEPGRDEKGAGHYHLVVPEPKKEEKPAARAEGADVSPEEPAAEASDHLATGGAVEKPAAEKPAAEKPAEEKPAAANAVSEAKPVGPDGRPALGFMPDYDGDVKGVLIGDLVPGGAAEAAKLKKGDVLIVLDGEDLEDLEDYMDVMANLRPGDKVRVKVRRGDKTLTKSVTLGSR